jgi:chemotaxis protein MotB
MSKAPESPPKNDKGAPMWVVTFGDMMSLLLCFFVLLLSFSEMDRQKYKQVAGSLEKAFGVQRKTKVMDPPKGIKMIARDFDQEVIATRLKELIGKEIEEEIETHLSDLKDQIELEPAKEAVTIRMMGESTFDSGEAVIKPEMKPLLKRIGDIIAKADGDIIIAGHTDNVPIHGAPFQSNLKLSIARAAAVAEFLLANASIRPSRLATMGFGEFRPIASNQTARGRQKNRRVEIIIGNLPKLPKPANE